MDTVKVEKERAMLRYRRLRRAAALSRWLLEALAVLALLSWSSDRLPAALALCAALLRRLPAVLFHPASAFLLVNLIVVTLFAKSGGHSAEGSSSLPPPSHSGAGDAHDHHRYDSYFSSAPLPQLHRGEEDEVVVYEDKAVCVVSTTAAAASATYCSGNTTDTTSPKKDSQKGRPLPRTRSSVLPFSAAMAGNGEKLFHRSGTDVGARRSAVEKWWPEEEEEEAEEDQTGRTAEDDNEEFRRRIEAFISKQMRFIEREEESLLLATAGAVVIAAGSVDRHRRQ